MPDEALITQIENLLSDVVALGGKNERTSIVPNLTVQDANPTGLSGWVIVSDDRDGDNILAKKVGSVIYNDNDLVNVMFIRGGEAIAFQQGSQSASSGIWSIVPSTSTDIYFDKGKVGIGIAAPTVDLHVRNTSGISAIHSVTTVPTSYASVRAEYSGPHSIEALQYGPFAAGVDTIGVANAGLALVYTAASTNNLGIRTSNAAANIIFGAGTGAEDMRIDAASGDVSLATGTLTLPSDIIHLGDLDNKISFTDDVQTYTVGGLVMLTLTEAAQDLITLGPGSGDVDIDFNGDMFLLGSNGYLGVGHIAPTGDIHIKRTATSSAVFVETTLNTSFARFRVFSSATHFLEHFQYGSAAAGTDTSGVANAGLALMYTGAGTTNMVIRSSNAATNIVFGAGAGVEDMRLASSGDLGLQNTDPTTPLNTGFSNIGMTIGDGTATAGLVLYSLTTSTLSSLRFADGGSGVYDQGFVIYNHNTDSMALGTNRATAVTIDSSQRVGVGITASLLGKMHIDQASTTGAIPVIVLDQADVSEEFIDFRSSIGAGNPIDTAAIGTYYGKARVAVNGTFKYVALYNS